MGKNLTEIASPKLVQAAQRLQTSAAVRDRANRLLNMAVLGQLDHFTIDLLRLDAVLDFVVKVTRSSYADLSVPPHARWRHFEVGEIDRWGMLASSRDWAEAIDLGRAAVDLAFISVLLDGLAGPGWAYAEAATGETFARGEGLAIASLVMFAGGAFSSNPYDPLRVDARALAGLTIEELSDGLQVSQSNVLTGLEARLPAINRLGQYMALEPDMFAVGDGIRPGGILDYLARTAGGKPISAPKLLQLVLKPLNTISPGRFALGGLALGETWPRNPALAQVAHLQESELAVEYRALTVALIDKIADGVRKRLGRPAEIFPLTCVLEGGTSSAGRRLAREKRPDGSPALVILADNAML
jgi:hypothetical protein